MCSLCHTYVHEAKRFCPEVLSFLHGVLSLSIGKPSPYLPAFLEPSKATSAMLSLTDEPLSLESLPLHLVSTTEAALSPTHRVAVVANALQQAAAMLSLYSTHPCKYCFYPPPLPHAVARSIPELNQLVFDQAQRFPTWLSYFCRWQGTSPHPPAQTWLAVCRARVRPPPPSSHCSCNAIALCPCHNSIRILK